MNHTDYIRIDFDPDHPDAFAVIQETQPDSSSEKVLAAIDEKIEAELAKEVRKYASDFASASDGPGSREDGGCTAGQSVGNEWESAQESSRTWKEEEITPAGETEAASAEKGAPESESMRVEKGAPESESMCAEKGALESESMCAEKGAPESESMCAEKGAPESESMRAEKGAPESEGMYAEAGRKEETACTDYQEREAVPAQDRGEGVSAFAGEQNGGTDDIHKILTEYMEGVDRINRTMQRLEKKFDSEILNAQNRDSAVRAIYKEMNEYKAGLVEKAMKNVLYDIADFRETMLSQIRFWKEKKEQDSIPLEEFASYADDLADILERYDVTIYKGEPGQENIAVRQKIVSKVGTEDDKLVKKVAKSLSYGYEYHAKVLYPEKISIYVKNSGDKKSGS